MRAIVVLPTLLALACGGAAKPTAAPAAAAAQAAQAELGPWPPTINWPERIALAIVSERETTGDDGKTRKEPPSSYVVAYERLDATRARFWEADGEGAANPYQRALAEANVYPALQIGGRPSEYEHGGYDAFQKTMLATKALTGSTPEVVKWREYLTIAEVIAGRSDVQATATVSTASTTATTTHSTLGRSLSLISSQRTFAPSARSELSVAVEEQSDL